MDTYAQDPDTNGTGGGFLLASALLIPLSVTAIIPNLAPLVWHIRSRNISTSSALIWIILLNFINLTNASIWHSSDSTSWFDGKVLCDIEVRIIVGGAFGGLTGATLCLAIGLSRVLDLDRQSPGGNTGDKRWVKDLALCWVPAVWMAVVYYAVQSLRYGIAPAYGCSPEYSHSWLTVVLLFIWPVCFMIVTCYYTGLVLYRLHTYRAQVSSLLARSATSRSRFMRLFVLAALLTLVLLVSSLVQLIIFVTAPLTAYSWTEVHADWNYARLLSESGTWGLFAGRWCWVVFGWMSFLTVGLGEEVVRKYRKGLEQVGLDKVLSTFSSQGGNGNADNRNSCVSSLGSRAKMFFHRDQTPKAPFDTLSLTRPSRLSKTSTNVWTKDSSPLLPITEPKATKRSVRSKLSLYTRMPSFGQALAGVSPSPINTSQKLTRSRQAASKILITVPSPTLGALNDDLILRMVGAEPAIKKSRPGEQLRAESIEMLDVTTKGARY